MRHTEAALRKARHTERLRGTVECSHCGFPLSEALVLSEPIVCAECDAEERGVDTMEAHHIAGRANSSFTIRLGANAHRVLTVAQRAWPSTTLRNAEHDTEIAIAALLRGIADILALVATCIEYDAKGNSL